MLTGEDSEFVGHEPCPQCGSKNNLARYSDGHGYCFGCQYYEKAEGQESMREGAESTKFEDAGGEEQESILTFEGEIRDLSARGIRRETCSFWSYRVGTRHGKTCHLAYYLDPESRKPVAAKVRFADKSFEFIGKPKQAPLYGQWLWRDHGKMIVITEGEIDAMSVSQVQNNKWPVVSVPNGAAGAVKAIRKSIDWLMKFDTVVLMFDMDEPGRNASIECAKLFPPGKAKIASLPMKDANELLQANRGGEIIDAIWGAKEYRPDGVVAIEDVKEMAMRPVEWGLPWFLETLTKATYGRRPTEVYTIGAGTGVGKTDFITQQMAYDVVQLGEKIGGIFLEQPVHETARRLAGKIAGKRFHVPDGSWTREEMSDALDMLDGKVYLYDHFGETEWDVVKERIRYMAVAQEIKLIYLDHLTAMADPSNERESLERLMKELAGIAQELGIIIHLISHLSTPEGRSHEEGGRVMIKHFKGARAIGFWSYFMFGIERNQQADEEGDRKTSIFRVLKDRYTGQATGLTLTMHYDPTTGMLSEQPFVAESVDDAF
jgi:twinkle protein